MEPPSRGTIAGVGPYNQRLLVSADVSGSATRECGLLPQHFHHRINVAVVTLLSLQYLLPTGDISRMGPALYLEDEDTGFVLVGLK